MTGTVADPDATDFAERALTVVEELLASHRAGEDSGAAVTVESGESALTRFAGSAIHQNVTEEIWSVKLAVHIGARSATVTGNPQDADRLRSLAEAAIRAAEVRPADPDWPGLAPAERTPAVEHADPATVTATPAARAALVRDFVEAAGGIECAGFCSTLGTRTAFANSAGARHLGQVSWATIDGVARAPSAGGPADGSGRQSAIAIGDLDAVAAGRRAGEIARAAADEPTELRPGRWPVVLHPAAFSDVLAFLAAYTLAARPLQEGRSFARLGELQFDPSLTLVCNPLDPRMPALPFDAEGTPRHTYELIREGVTREVAADRRDARRAAAAGGSVAGVASNGGALSHPWLSGGLASAVAVQPGSEASDELLGGIERGLLVHDFWYTRVLDPRPLTVTGLTRNGAFLIEDGVVTEAVHNVRFTQSYAEALAPGQVLALGGDLELLGDPTQSYLTPAIALASWNVTGGASG